MSASDWHPMGPVYYCAECSTLEPRGPLGDADPPVCPECGGPRELRVRYFCMRCAGQAIPRALADPPPHDCHSPLLPLRLEDPAPESDLSLSAPLSARLGVSMLESLNRSQRLRVLRQDGRVLALKPDEVAAVEGGAPGGLTRGATIYLAGGAVVQVEAPAEDVIALINGGTDAT